MLQSDIVKMIVLDVQKHMDVITIAPGCPKDHLKQDIQEWLELHVGDPWDLYPLDENTHKIRDDTPEEDDREFSVWGLFFGKAEDAFAFKMRWC